MKKKIHTWQQFTIQTQMTPSLAVRGERIYNMPWYYWLETFFPKVAPWVDTCEQGHQDVTGYAKWSCQAGRLAVIAMAEGRSAYDGWDTMIFCMQNSGPAIGSEEIEARSRQMLARKHLRGADLVRNIEALSRTRIEQMIQMGTAFVSAFYHTTSGFSFFVGNWSFRAGALVTFGIAEGKDERLIADEVAAVAFLASAGDYIGPLR